MDNHAVLNFFLGSQGEIYAGVNTSCCTSRLIKPTEQPMTGGGGGGENASYMSRKEKGDLGRHIFIVWV